MTDQAGWIAEDRQDNSLATASKAAATGKQYVLYSVGASYSGSVTALLQIKDGTTVIIERDIVNSADLQFPKGIAITKGNAVSAELAASGTGGTFGSVHIHGVTR